jgi:hypothetical protein
MANREVAKNVLARGGQNSFDQSLFFSLKNSADPLFDQTYRPGRGSASKAENKVIRNQYADMSRLLNKIDRLSPPRRPDVPYYRRNEAP